MEFQTKKYKKINEDVQSSLTDADLLTKAAELESRKVDAKKTLDAATKTYNDVCQQVDQQMVQLIHTQAQRNGQAAKSNTSSSSSQPKQENESEQVLNEENSDQYQRVLLDSFMPRLLGLAYNDKVIMKIINQAGLRCYDDPDNGLTVVLRNPGDLGILFQVMEDNYLEPNEYETPILEQLPGEFTRSFYSGEY